MKSERNRKVTQKPGPFALIYFFVFEMKTIFWSSAFSGLKKETYLIICLYLCLFFELRVDSIHNFKVTNNSFFCYNSSLPLIFVNILRYHIVMMILNMCFLFSSSFNFDKRSKKPIDSDLLYYHASLFYMNHGPFFFFKDYYDVDIALPLIDYTLLLNWSLIQSDFTLIIIDINKVLTIRLVE